LKPEDIANGIKAGELAIVVGEGGRKTVIDPNKVAPHPLMKIVRQSRPPASDAHGFIDLGRFKLPYRLDEPSLDGAHIHVWLGVGQKAEINRDDNLLAAAEIANQHTMLHILTWSAGSPISFTSHKMLKRR
jgi:hypothetical protein